MFLPPDCRVSRSLKCMLILPAVGILLLAGSGRAVAADDHPFPNHHKAPSLADGEGWINTAGPIDLKQLRGKFVILDFWTYCCINCMHILPQLKKLEHAYPNEIVVIGVHSAKFASEWQTARGAEPRIPRFNRCSAGAPTEVFAACRAASPIRAAATGFPAATARG